MNQPEENHIIGRGRMLAITMFSVLIVYLLWNVAALSFVAYPFRLFVTYVHEAGHALAAIISGGEVVGFTVSSDGSGLATTRGGSRALILPAGYIGAAMFGAGLFYVVHRWPQAVRWTAGVIGGGLIVFTLLYARPDAHGAPIALIVGLLFGAGLLALAYRASGQITILVLSVLAIMTGLNAVLDITTLVGWADSCAAIGRDVVCNDAYAFHRDVAPFLPAAAWALIWAAISIALCAASVYYSLVQPLLAGEESQQVTAERTPANTTRRGDGLDGIKRDKDGNIDWSQF